MDPMLSMLIVAGLAFMAVAGVGYAFAPGAASADVATKRAKTIAKDGRRERADSDDSIVQKRKQGNADALKALAERQKSSKRQIVSIKGRIAQAGLSITVPMFWAGSAAAAAAAGAGLFLAGAPPLVAAGVAIVVGLGLPRWVLGFLISMRQKKFVLQLSDALDVIVRGVKSGLPLGQCMQIIAKESPSPLKEEFQRLVDGQAVGSPLDVNLQRMYERMPLPEVNFFNIVLLIQAKAGGNLSEALGNLSTVLRARRMLREKIKALSAEAKMSAMIIGAMPFVVAAILMVVQPDYIPVLFTTETGRLVLVVCAAMLITGILVMRNMINFKF